MSYKHHTRSTKSQSSRGSQGNYPQQSDLNDDNSESATFGACAATASYFLYAQKNIISCLHYDTLAVERRFDKHSAEVLLIEVDNVSERGNGRFVASYDSSKTAIVWDLLTGDEIARFAAYEFIRVAAWMRDGSVAFGNELGNIILFEPATSEHISEKTIYDPITALAPAADCRTFAIGYQNGSIIIATLNTFNVIYTLSTSRGPSPIIGLAWHGSSSKQKADMLATQTADGDLRIWSIAKTSQGEQPRIIRVLGSPDNTTPAKSWFGWSKNGRVIQHFNRETRSWDVRTKRVSWQSVPTIDDIAAICNFGPTSTLFTVGTNHTVQQYDLSHDQPTMVAHAHHVPINAPPTPPDTIDDQRFRKATPTTAIAQSPPRFATPAFGETSVPEGPRMASIEEISREMDDLEAERRDQLAPLSPVSSRASMSSVSSYGRSRRPGRSSTSSRGSGSEGTIFSSGTPPPNTISPRPDMRHFRNTGRRNTLETDRRGQIDLFPVIRQRLRDVKYRPPHYGNAEMTADVLQREMLSVVFGWESDVESLVRDEQSRHEPDSMNAILLSRWLGDISTESMAQMANMDALSSSDLMLLTLSCQLGGQGSQKQLGEVFVARFLEKDEIHSAVAILIGLNDLNAAIEAYSSRNYYLEAVILTCLYFPNDWQSQSFLVRKWGESAINQGQAELAVRCFACLTMNSVDSHFQRDSQRDSQRGSTADTLSPPNSPPSATVPNRMTAKNASLKLITNFGDKGLPAPVQTLGATPIADTAATPVNKEAWPRRKRDESATRTATPGGARRLPSTGPRSYNPDSDATPLVPNQQFVDDPLSAFLKRPESSQKSHSRPRSRRSESLTSGTENQAITLEQKSRSRTGSTDRNYHHLEISTRPVVETVDALSPGVSVASYNSRTSRSRASQSRRDDLISPSLASDGSFKGSKSRNIDRYIESLEEANNRARQRSQSRTRTDRDSHRSRSRARPRDASESRGRSDVTYIKPAKRSPSSPKPMTSDDASKYQSRDSYGEEKTFILSGDSQSNYETKERPMSGSTEGADGRGRNSMRKPGSVNRSPPSPAPMAVDSMLGDDSRRENKSRSRSRHHSNAQGRARSTSRIAKHSEQEIPLSATALEGEPGVMFGLDNDDLGSLKSMSRKELAARELQERRLSLARRPSAPPIPEPGNLYASMSPVSESADPFGVKSFLNEDVVPRSHTADPDAMMRYSQRITGTSTSSVPIGLPATPRAMRHPKYMGSDANDRDEVPAVPAIPENLAALAYGGDLQSQKQDGLGPLLPSTVYSAKPPFARSQSAPPEKFIPGLPARPSSRPNQESSTGRSHARRTSTASESQHARRSGVEKRSSLLEPPAEEEHVIIVDELEPANPPVLEELQHLAGPPPPPPPPTMFPSAKAINGSGVINIAIEGADSASDVGMTALNPATSNLHRRSQTTEAVNSLGGNTSKWRSVTDRMRNSSRSRTKSPPSREFSTSPYETILPGSVYTSNKAKSAHAEGNPIAAAQERLPLPGMPIPELEHLTRVSSTPNAYRNPKEIRANMPPASMQPGSTMEGGMI